MGNKLPLIMYIISRRSMFVSGWDREKYRSIKIDYSIKSNLSFLHVRMYADFSNREAEIYDFDFEYRMFSMCQEIGTGGEKISNLI